MITIVYDDYNTGKQTLEVQINVYIIIVCSRLIQKHRTQGRQRQDNSDKPSARVTLPYIQGMSEAIRRVLGELDIQTAFKPLVSLRNILSHPKDPISQESRSSVIYRIPCADCSKSYVGQIGRNLSQKD